MKKHNVRDSKGRFAPKNTVIPIVKAKVKRIPKKKVNREIYDIILLDESSSMGGRNGHAAVLGFNKHIDSVANDSIKNKINTYSSLYKFTHSINRMSFNENCSNFNKLSYASNSYYPGGSTALYKVVVNSITDMKNYLSENNKLGSKDVDVTITMFTDGEDTSSSGNDLIVAKQLIKEVTELYKWTIAFIGAGNKQSLINEANKIGIHESNVLVVEGTEEEIKMSFDTLSSSRSVKTMNYSSTGVSDNIGYFQQ